MKKDLNNNKATILNTKTSNLEISHFDKLQSIEGFSKISKESNGNITVEFILESMDSVPDILKVFENHDIEYEILSTVVEGTTAAVKVRDKYLGITFLDTLSLIKIDNEWSIYNKLFNVEE